MLKKAELRKKGKNAYYRNWKTCIIICFIYTLFIGGTLISINHRSVITPDNIKKINIRLKGEDNSDIVNDFIKGVTGNSSVELAKNATEGVLGILVNNVSKSGSFMFGILNALNEIIFKNRIWASIIIIIGALLSLAYWIFVSKVLEVGYARFYLENRKYTKTKSIKLLFPYRLHKTTNVAFTMFLKNLYTILWMPTIIGPFIKYYTYYLVPYILAENPTIKPKDALLLSRDMMNGYKWEMFKLDLSFIGYQLLGLLTFNIANIVFTDPIMNTTRVEAYFYLKEILKDKQINNFDLLNDTYLDGGLVFGEYPTNQYNITAHERKKWLKFDYQSDYTLGDLVLLFFAISILGWFWEVFFHLFQYGNFVNRGTLYGPWLPIYGAGSVVLLVLLKKKRNSPFVYFILSMLICGIIEYATSVYLELAYHLSWWDYHGYFLNLNGRICLEGLIVFGIGGTAITYIVAPFISNFLDKIKRNYKTIIIFILLLFFVVDFSISCVYPHTGDGITTVIPSTKLN